MTMEGLLRLGPMTWVNPQAIRAVLWETDFEGRRELHIYHPAAMEGDYFQVARDCEFDVVKALGIEMPPADEGGQNAG